MTVGDLSRRDAVVADAGLKLHDAAKLLRRARRWDVPVIEVRGAGARLLGILRAADLVASTSIEDLGWVGSLLVSDVMTTNIEPLREDDPIDRLLVWFQTHGVSNAPVVNERGFFAGVVEFGEVVGELATELASQSRRRPSAERLIIDLEEPN